VEKQQPMVLSLLKMQQAQQQVLKQQLLQGEQVIQHLRDEFFRRFLFQ
jgi:hypothetical protein